MPARPSTRSGAARPPPKSKSRHQICEVKSKDPELVVLVDKLFVVSDADKGGSIDFAEFLVQHRNIINATDIGGEETDQMTENRFREFDKDNSLALDQDEWRLYMDSVLAIVGKRRFMDIGEALYEDTLARRNCQQKTYDAASSAMLLEKIRGAHRIRAGMYENIQTLIENQADVNFRDSSKTTAFMYAVDKSDDDFVRWMLNIKADPLIYNEDMDCPIFRCAKARNHPILKMLLCPSGEQDVHDKAAKQIADANRNMIRDMANLTGADVSNFLKKNADLNYRDHNGWTPITAAIFWEKIDCVELLLKTPAPRGKTKVNLELLNGRGRAPIHIAARKGFDNILVLLLRANNSVDLQDVDGWTALHHAAFNGNNRCIQVLLQNGSSLQVQGRLGLTACMVAKLPDCAGNLPEDAVKRMDVPDNFCFAKAILPIFKDEEKSLFEKLDAILDLPGIHRNPFNLRLYEQNFESRRGPNKVRIQKVWETLALPLLRRLHSGETDLPSIPDDPDRIIEITQRRKEQTAFLTQWFADTKGPRMSALWNYKNREFYDDELRSVVKEEIGKFKTDFIELYNNFKDRPGGNELALRMPVELKDQAFTSQLQAHPMLFWLQNADVSGAFDWIRTLGGIAGEDADQCVTKFLDFLNEPDFSNGSVFWRNIYPYWLSLYGKIAEREINMRISGLVQKFKDANSDKASNITVRTCPTKSYERIKAKLKRFGQAENDTYECRVRAGKVLDVVRCSISVGTPKLAVLVVDEVFEPLRLAKDRVQLMRIENRFSQDADVQKTAGYRNIELTCLFDMGFKPGLCGRKEIKVQLLGEVQIVLEDFIALAKRRSVLERINRGEFDWDESDPVPDSITQADEDLVLTANGTDE